MTITHTEFKTSLQAATAKAIRWARAAIANIMIDTAQLVDGAVTNDKLAGSITADKLAGSIPYSKLSFSNDIVAGDIAANAVGASEIASGSISNTHIASNAAIAGTKIDPDFGSQAVESTGTATFGRMRTGVANAVVNSSSPTGTLFTLGNGDLWIAMAKYRAGSNTGAVAFAIISSHSSSNNVYVSNVQSTILGFENHTGMSIRLFSTSGSSTTATITWIRIN